MPPGAAESDEHRPAVMGQGPGQAGPDIAAGARADGFQGAHQEGAGGLGPELLPGPGLLADQPVPQRDPDPAPRVFPDRPLAWLHRHEVRAAEPSDRPGRADPDLARVVHGDRGIVQGEAPWGRAIRSRPRAPRRQRPSRVPTQNSAGTVQEDGMDRVRNLELRDLPQAARPRRGTRRPGLRAQRSPERSCWSRVYPGAPT